MTSTEDLRRIFLEAGIVRPAKIKPSTPRVGDTCWDYLRQSAYTWDGANWTLLEGYSQELVDLLHQVFPEVN